MRDWLKFIRKCQICKKPRPKDCAVVVVNGGKNLRICEECERILQMANIAAHSGVDDVDEPV
jgi:hypothetical protein